MVVFITGISSGFGMETARLLAEEGHVVYGTVRREVTPLPKVHYLLLDVRDRQAVKEAVAQIVEKEGRLDVLVNNAGMGIGGPVEFATEEEVREQMEANLMSSIGGVMGLPYQGFYSASKFAIEGYCEALRLETKPFGITVTVIRPGDFSTGFTANRKKTTNTEAMQAYPGYAESIAKAENDEQTGLKPIVLAQCISKVIRKKHPRYAYVVSSFEQRLSVLLKRVLPEKWFASILGSYYNM